MVGMRTRLVIGAAILAQAVTLPALGQERRGRGQGNELGWRLTLMAYTFRERTLFDAIDQAKALGIRNLEAYSWQKVSPDTGDVQFNADAPPAVLAKVKITLDDAGVRLIGYYFHELGKDKAETQKVFDFAKVMGVQYIVCETAPTRSTGWRNWPRVLRIAVAVHNHPSRRRTAPGYRAGRGQEPGK